MKQIIKAQDMVLNILGRTPSTTSGYRMSTYCVSVPVERGALLHNLLTREMLLLTEDEYADRLTSVYLREHWFVVPETINEREYVGLVRWALQSKRKNLMKINNFTILTTTDCNARCFYCYEKGCTRITMTDQTAREVVTFIKQRCGGKKVHLAWFGGEPLMNERAIDIICEGLQSEGIEYTSGMTSNGFLFNEALAERAVESWHLRKVQITLDGTEEVYNRSKAYVGVTESAYQVVLSNIERLLSAGITVNIRMNMNPDNMDNLVLLTEELADRFGNVPGLRVYAKALFDVNTNDPREQYTWEEWRSLYATIERINEHLEERDITIPTRTGLRRDLRLYRCMADSGNSVVIVPDGHVGLCEHYCESEFIGDLKSREWDMTKVTQWRQYDEELPECQNCFYYPECVRLRKCTGRVPCTEWERSILRREHEKSMVTEYRRWLDNSTKSVCE